MVGTKCPHEDWNSWQFWPCGDIWLVHMRETDYKSAAFIKKINKWINKKSLKASWSSIYYWSCIENLPRVFIPTFHFSCVSTMRTECFFVIFSTSCDLRHWSILTAEGESVWNTTKSFCALVWMEVLNLNHYYVNGKVRGFFWAGVLLPQYAMLTFEI